MKHSRMTLKVVCGAALGLAWLLALGASAARAHTVTCSSQNGRRNVCSLDTRRGVALVRQLSHAPCRWGRTWGVRDSHRIWVDDGCRGVFRSTGHGHGHGHGGHRGSRRVVCESRSRNRTYCRADARRGVTLERRLSKAPCVRNRSWGYSRGRIWVDHGCRAEFRVLR